MTPFGVDQVLGRGPEGEAADLELGVLAGVVLAQLQADARQQHGEAEWLGDIVVGPRLEAHHRVGVGIVGGQHDDRPLEAVGAQMPDRLASVHVGQADVHDDDVGRRAGGRLARRGGVGRFRDVEFGMQRQLFAQRLPQVGIVVDDEDSASLRHEYPVRECGMRTPI